MAKRVLDLAVSGLGLLGLSPLLAAASLLIWLEDRRSPLYVGSRIGRGGRRFRMVKLRSMVVNGDQSGLESTSTDDPRITRVGRLIRKFKLDEFAQLWNVFRGEMSLVGPRPQVARDVALYTVEERHLLDVSPGITDFSSIVFADEGDILEGASDPDLRYNQVIRPWKSRLGLHYIRHRSMWLDVRIVLATMVAVVSRRSALRWVVAILKSTGADAELVDVASRRSQLTPAPPPGATEVVQSRVSNLAQG